MVHKEGGVASCQIVEVPVIASKHSKTYTKQDEAKNYNIFFGDMHNYRKLDDANTVHI